VITTATDLTLILCWRGRLSGVGSEFIHLGGILMHSIHSFILPRAWMPDDAGRLLPVDRNSRCHLMWCLDHISDIYVTFILHFILVEADSPVTVHFWCILPRPQSGRPHLSWRWLRGGSILLRSVEEEHSCVVPLHFVHHYVPEHATGIDFNSSWRWLGREFTTFSRYTSGRLGRCWSRNL